MMIGREEPPGEPHGHNKQIYEKNYAKSGNEKHNPPLGKGKTKNRKKLWCDNDEMMGWTATARMKETCMLHADPKLTKRTIGQQSEIRNLELISFIFMRFLEFEIFRAFDDFPKIFAGLNKLYF